MVDLDIDMFDVVVLARSGKEAPASFLIGQLKTLFYHPFFPALILYPVDGLLTLESGSDISTSPGAYPSDLCSAPSLLPSYSKDRSIEYEEPHAEPWNSVSLLATNPLT